MSMTMNPAPKRVAMSAKKTSGMATFGGAKPLGKPFSPGTSSGAGTKGAMKTNTFSTTGAGNKGLS